MTEVRGWLRGEGPDTHLPQRPAPQPVPIYVAALTSRTVEQAAELADGVMPTFWSPERVRQSTVWIERGRARSPHLGPLDITLGLPTFVGDDVAALRDVARGNLGLYTTFPFFRRMWRASGFRAEADAMDRGAGAAALSDELLDSFCLIGPVQRCRERLAEYRAAGVELPILGSPIGPAAALDVIRAFAPQGAHPQTR